MDKKKRIIWAVCAAALLIFFSFVIIRAFDIHFNIITYHSFEQDGYSFKFKGSFDTVRKVVIKKDSKKIGSLPFDAASSVFEENESEYSARLEDINGDGNEDIILPCLFDSDGDIHYTVYLSGDGGKLAYHEELKDLPNLTIDNELILTEETTRETLLEGTSNSPEIYIVTHRITKLSFINGDFIALEERAVIYYSENDYYCYSIYAYDDNHGGLKYVDEKWFDPEDIDKYPLKWE